MTQSGRDIPDPTESLQALRNGPPWWLHAILFALSALLIAAAAMLVARAAG